MATVLLIGYSGFGDYALNPAESVARALDGERIGDADIVSEVLPVDSAAAPDLIRSAIEAHEPSLVIGLGVYPGAIGLQVERIAVNVMDFQVPDAAGNQWSGKAVEDGGPTAYTASVPVKAMVHAMRKAGVPTKLSNSASTHMCNQTLYTELHHIATRGMDARAGFIHLPDLPEFVASRNEWGPTMSLETMLIGVRAGLAAALENQRDLVANVEAWEW